ncbi:hypothetical protein F2Q69_00009957 [Brassica cretica]|uniref:Serine-threonine/tyrosine-protein kinase catalytic domain-containing protein n=1 Tax=Brassica cretica TaxID=69181 RepID=A0A8S9PRN0_BRACR|nr:hypothetical protein F2Q69_00009957 [Brassica cretica]
MVVTGGKGCSDQFEAEVSVLPRVHHRNHVILHGYFVQGDKKLFVYKYMPQGPHHYAEGQGIKDIAFWDTV